MPIIQRESKALPAVGRIQAFWDTGRMIRNPLHVLLEHSNDLGENYHYYFGGVKKVLVSSDPKVLQHILKDNYHNYRKSEIQVKRMGQFLGNGLLTSHGQYWRRQRQLIQQGFRPSALAALAPVMHMSLQESLLRLDTAVKKVPRVNLCSEMRTITFSMVARSLFSARMTDSEIQHISDAITAIQAFMVRRLVQPYLAAWFVVSGELRKHQAMRRAGDAILLRQIRNRRMSQCAGNDLLDILIHTLYDGTEQSMTDTQVLNESMQLLVAGHETSSNALAWTIYLLCRYPDYMQRARREFDAVLRDAPLDYAHLPLLKLNTCILKEALRLYPPFWMIDRVAVDKDRVANITIARGTLIIAFLYGAHHSVAYWEDPERFNPNRFDNDQPKTGVGFAYLPFGGGPRGCIGANYAMLQMLMILSVMLRKYDISLIHDRPIEMQPMFILRPRGGIPVRIDLRA